MGVVWGECSHVFHMHCLLKWIGTPASKQQCPMDRRTWGMCTNVNRLFYRLTSLKSLLKGKLTRTGPGNRLFGVPKCINNGELYCRNSVVYSCDFILHCELSHLSSTDMVLYRRGGLRQRRWLQNWVIHTVNNSRRLQHVFLDESPV